MVLIAGPGGRPVRRARVDWQVLVPRLIHSTKVVIVEAMLWIERPLSATELAKMTNGTITVSAISYHLDRLVEVEALEVVAKLKVRKTQGSKKEKFFYVAGEHRWASQIAGLNDLVDPLLKTAVSVAGALVSR
jgi:hypothetical protein